MQKRKQLFKSVFFLLFLYKGIDVNSIMDNYFLDSLTNLFKIAHCFKASRASTAG